MISDFFVTTITITTPSNSVFDEAAVIPSFSPTRQPADTGVLRFLSPMPEVVEV